MKDFIKAFIIINKDKNPTQLTILKEIKYIYGKLKINFDSIKKEYIVKKTFNYKKKHKLNDGDKVVIEQIFNINNIIKSSYNYLRFYKEYKGNFNDNNN